MHVDFDTCTTTEECLALLGEWFTHKERTEEEMKKIIAVIQERTKESVSLVPSALGILFDEQGHLLLLRRKKDARSFPDSFSFPGGQMDKEDVSLEETVVRETLQETGLQTEILSYHSTRYTTVPKRHRIYQVAFYILGMNGVEKPIQLSNEHTEYVCELPKTIISDPKKYPLSGNILEELIGELI